MEPTNSDNPPVDSQPTDFSAIETPEELRVRTTASETGDEGLVPALDRPRPPRAPIIPRGLIITAAAAVVVLIMAGVGIAVYLRASLVTVPDVVGSELALARTTLAGEGLRVVVREERFSPRPLGEVLSQSPRATSRLKKGKAVYVVVSAGIEEFAMPDVVGDGLALARGTLETKGLVMETEEVVSSVASGTVLSTIPAAGAMVRSGDVIRVMIATSKRITTGLEPFRMDGVSVLIDPATVPADRPDVNLEVARRLRALLEASGASVIVLRTGVDTSTTEADRATAAVQASATVGVGISTRPSGAPGRSIVGPGATAILRAKLAARLQAVAPPATAGTATADPVLSSFRGPWFRITLGSFNQRLDESAFADPRWADEVARAMYSALGEVYGRKEGL
jgi:hypothetical protein